MLDRKWLRLIIALAICVWINKICAQEPNHLPYSDVVKLSPQMRSEPLTATIYSVNSGKLALYLNNIIIFDNEDQFEALPYIVAFDRDKSMANVGDIAYTMGLDAAKDISSYTTLLLGAKLIHPDTGENIGVEAFVTGNAIIQQPGNPQTILITKVIKAIDLNTRLIPSVGVDLPSIIDVKYPDKMLHGYVLSVQSDEIGGGVCSTVVISLGERDGVKQGHVLDIMDSVRERKDQYTDDIVSLPISKIGEVLVYKTAKKTSLGIITYSNRMIIPLDKLAVPQRF